MILLLFYDFTAYYWMTTDRWRKGAWHWQVDIKVCLENDVPVVHGQMCEVRG